MTKTIPHKIKKNPRFVAMELLTKVAKQQAYSNLLVNEAMKKAQLTEKDGRLLTELVYGTIARKITLEFYLEPFISQAKKVDVWVKELLLVSLYQMLYLDRIPEHAIFNDAVEIAKGKGNEGVGKFVNGVLRSIQRKGVTDLSNISDSVERLAIEISMPLWLTKKFVAELGMDETRKMGLSLFEPSRVSARFNPQLIGQEQAVEILQENGLAVEPSQISPYGLVGDKGFLAGSDLFEHGELTIQDESSMLVAPAMQIEAHHQVLDACAAPGGKTTHIASFLNQETGGKVTALDIHPHKIKLIEENAKRQHVSDLVVTQVMDAREVAAEFPDEYFDRILTDVPCSGLGLIRRKPDIKYSKKAEDFLTLQKIQLEILESVVQKLKVYGIITYSTCTITPEENQQVIETFLNSHPNFEKIDIVGSERIPKAVKNQCIQLYPHYYKTDGFFVCCLRRNF